MTTYITTVGGGKWIKIPNHNLEVIATLEHGVLCIGFRMGGKEIFLVITKSLAWNKTYYLCIPHGNQQLVNRYWADLNAWDRPISIAYSQVMSVLFGGLMTEAYNLEKKLKN